MICWLTSKYRDAHRAACEVDQMVRCFRCDSPFIYLLSVPVDVLAYGLVLREAYRWFNG